MKVVLDTNLFYDDVTFNHSFPSKLLAVACYEYRAFDWEFAAKIMTQLTDLRSRLTERGNQDIDEKLLRACNMILMPYARAEYIDTTIKELLEERGMKRNGNNGKLRDVLNVSGNNTLIYGVGFSNVLQQLPVLNGVDYTSVTNSIDVYNGRPRFVIGIRRNNKYNLRSNGLESQEVVYVGTDPEMRDVPAHYIDFSARSCVSTLREILRGSEERVSVL